MPMVYTVTTAAVGNLTTSGTPNTATDAFFVKAGVRNVHLVRVETGGKGGALATMSGIVYRLLKWGTASTAGTSITPTARDPGMQAAKATAASRPTAGTTRTNGPVFVSTATGPGGWWPTNADEYLELEGGGAPSLDMEDASATASLTYEFAATIYE